MLYELTEYVLDRNRPYVETLMQKDGAGNLSTIYTYGNQRINSESINNISGIYTYDGRGSVSSVIGGFGYYRATYWYDGLGNVVRNLYGAGDSNNRYKPYYGYNAESYNPVTGNQNLRARQLNIRRQRFLTENTYLGNKTDVLSINRYIYANDNPLRYTDPSGNVIPWLAIAGIAAGLAALGVGIYTGVTTGSWEEGLKAGATVGLAVGVGVATVGLATAGSVTVGAGVVVKGVLASTQVVTAAGSGTGAILATSAMAGTATYKAGQRFIQGKNVGLGEAVNSVASAGYAGYNIGNAISLGSTYINSKTGAIDSWIGSLNSAANTSNTYQYGDINENAGYVNPDGTGGRLNQEMAGATANSVSGGCENAPVDYSASSSNNEHYLHRPYIRKGTTDAINANTDYNEKGQVWDKISEIWVDADKVELGHKAGNEFWKMRNWAESQNMTQSEFNDYMNNPDFYAWQDIHSNRRHIHELP